MDETESLEETVKIILQTTGQRVQDLLIVVCDRTTPQAMAVVRRINEDLGDMVTVHHQQLPFLGGALREAFQIARGSHVVLMASDLETDPRDLRPMLEMAERNPSAIIAASRWLKPGSFHGYSIPKLVFNWIFQKFFSILYGARLTDMTFAYRVYPTDLVRSVQWEELRHPFLFESLVKPLRLGVRIIEIPSAWKARTEGQSQNTFLRNFVYFRTGIKTRFVPREALLKPLSTAPAR